MSGNVIRVFDPAIASDDDCHARIDAASHGGIAEENLLERILLNQQKRDFDGFSKSRPRPSRCFGHSE
jgi:hypothetical protein